MPSPGVRLFQSPNSEAKSSRSVLRDHPIDDSVVLGLLGAHEVIPFGVLLDLLNRLAGVMGDDLIQAPPDIDDLARVDLDVGGLSLEARGHMMDQDLGVRKRHPLAVS